MSQLTTSRTVKSGPSPREPQMRGNAAVVILLVIILVALAFFGGFKMGQGGAGDADGKGEGTAVPLKSAEPDPSDRFTIVVEEDRILVDGTEMEASAVVEKAKADGRPVQVTWRRAKTSAEDELKRALTEAEIRFDEVSE